MKYFTLMLKTWQGGHACGVSLPLPHTLRILGGAPLSLESGASLATSLRVPPLKLLVEVALGEIGHSKKSPCGEAITICWVLSWSKWTKNVSKHGKGDHPNLVAFALREIHQISGAQKELNCPIYLLYCPLPLKSISSLRFVDLFNTLKRIFILRLSNVSTTLTNLVSSANHRTESWPN